MEISLNTEGVSSIRDAMRKSSSLSEEINGPMNRKEALSNPVALRKMASGDTVELSEEARRLRIAQFGEKGTERIEHAEKIENDKKAAEAEAEDLRIDAEALNIGGALDNSKVQELTKKIQQIQQELQAAQAELTTDKASAGTDSGSSAQAKVDALQQQLMSLMQELAAMQA